MKTKELITQKTQQIFKVMIFFVSALAAVLIGAINSPIKFVIPAAFVGFLILLISIHNLEIPLYLFIVSVGLGEILKTDLLPTTFLVIPGLILSLSWLLDVLIKGREAKLNLPTLILAISLGTWSSFSALTKGDVLTSRPYWLVIILFIILQNLFLTKKQFQKAAWVILLTLTCISLIVFYDRFNLFIAARGNISVFDLHKAYLPFGDKIAVGMYISLGIPIAYFMIKLQSSLRRICLLYVIMGILALGVFSVFSLGVMVGVFIMVFLIIILDWQTLKQNRGILLVVMVILILYFLGPMVDRIQGQIQLVQERGVLALGTNRLLVWATSLKLIRLAPWFGIGVEVVPRTTAAYPFVPQDYWDLFIIKRGGYIIPHNSILTVATQIGLPGAMLFGFLRIWILGMVIRLKILASRFDPFLKNYINIFLVVLVGAYVQSLAISAQLDKFVWLMMGMAVALGIYSVKISNTTDQMGAGSTG